jgi:hypothetical protein
MVKRFDVVLQVIMSTGRHGDGRPNSPLHATALRNAARER